jgi:hypothetical protein
LRFKVKGRLSYIHAEGVLAVSTDTALGFVYAAASAVVECVGHALVNEDGVECACSDGELECDSSPRMAMPCEMPCNVPSHEDSGAAGSSP